MIDFERILANKPRNRNVWLKGAFEEACSDFTEVWRKDDPMLFNLSDSTDANVNWFFNEGRKTLERRGFRVYFSGDVESVVEIKMYDPELIDLDPCCVHINLLKSLKNEPPHKIIDNISAEAIEFFDNIRKKARRNNNMYENMYKKSTKESLKAEITPAIRNVVLNPPATIVFWEDNTKTVVKTQNGEAYDPEKGMAMAIAKKYFGNKGAYFDQIKKWTEADVK